MQAINPLAESLPNSARTTPRDMGGDAPPPPAPLQQQYQRGAAALPLGPPLSRQSSYAALPPGLAEHAQQHAQQAQRGPTREGSFAARLAGKVMGGMGGASPMDRLRRLSSGHYQQQHLQQQQHQAGQPPYF